MQCGEALLLLAGQSWARLYSAAAAVRHVAPAAAAHACESAAAARSEAAPVAWRPSPLPHHQPPSKASPSGSGGGSYAGGGGASTQQHATPPRPAYRAVLIDAVGTLLLPTEPAAAVYLRYARPFGCQLGEREILERFRRVYNTPWGESPRRYIGDARPFWHHIVKESTGCGAAACSEAIYQYYASREAWRLAPGSLEALARLRGGGLQLAVVSNFDTRLRPLLDQLGVLPLLDAVVVSAEVHAEKPNPAIFEAALQQLRACAHAHAPALASAAPDSAATGTWPLLLPSAAAAAHPPAAPAPPLEPYEVLHVGDDRRNDVFGARDAGCAAWLWGSDVRSWEQPQVDD